MPTIIFQPDAAAGIDTHLSGGASAGNNNGIREALIFGVTDVGVRTNFALIKFTGLSDGSISSSVAIDSAKLELFSLNFSNQTADVTVAFFKVIRPWVEGNKFSTVASDGESSFNHSIKPTLWGTPGCENTTTDYVNVSFGTTIFENNSAATKTLNFNAAGLTYIRDVVDGSITDEGMKISGGTVQGEVAAALSSDNIAVANRPKLTVVTSGITAMGGTSAGTPSPMII